MTSTHSNAKTLAGQPFINTLYKWLTTNRLNLAPAKSTSTLLTYLNSEHTHTHTDTDKILGVTYNTSMSFHRHTANSNSKLTTSLKALKSLAHTKLGQTNKPTTQYTTNLFVH